LIIVFDKILKPRLPSCAVGLDGGCASVVQLDRGRNGFTVKRAASVELPSNLIRPSFHETNIDEPTELAGFLSNLITSAGLLRQRKWSVTLPEATARSAIMTLEGKTGSRRELEEVLEWKTERSFGASLSELRVTREQLAPDGQNQTRYLISAIRLSVLAEYESVFAALGWHAGLILPRHDGEAQWLSNGHHGAGLLLTGHEEGFTAVLLRGAELLTLRTVFCDPEETDDELHRVLLFYRERSGSNGEGQGAVDRLLVTGKSLDKEQVAKIAQETLGVDLRPMGAAEVGLNLPSRELPFDMIAAPAGLARMAW
jgi:Tfp pilus assembly PilM family ATPase